VLDCADGSPIADVSVKLQDENLSVKTDAAGRFELAGVRPGRRTVLAPRCPRQPHVQLEEQANDLVRRGAERAGPP
jgi:hypothetical protein